MHGRFIGEIKRMSIIFYKSFISFIVSLEVSDGAKGTNDRFAIIGMAGGDQNTKGLSKIAATNFGNLSETVWKAHMFFLFRRQRRFGLERIAAMGTSYSLIAHLQLTLRAEY